MVNTRYLPNSSPSDSSKPDKVSVIMLKVLLIHNELYKDIMVELQLDICFNPGPAEPGYSLPLQKV